MWALAGFHKDADHVANLVNGLADRGCGEYKGQKQKGSNLTIYECENLKLSMLRGQVIDILCTQCGDIYVDEKRAVCKCALIAIIDILQ